jgi:hypothetical protein
MRHCSFFAGFSLLVLCTAFSSRLKQLKVGGKQQSRLSTPEHSPFLTSEVRHNQLNKHGVLSIHAQASSSTIIPATTAPHRLSVQQLIYVILTSTFVTCLIVADVIGVKIFEFTLPFAVFGHKTVEHTCGMLTFPITFLLGDIINEYYGAKATKQTVYIGLAMSVLVFGVMNVAQALPYLQKPFNGKLFC